jgi:predicted phage baseplate assembly protein
VSYEHTGGAPANVAADTISQLYSVVPYVQSVTNPVAAAGGASGEEADRVRLRGPQHLRHRDRAMAAIDYEWLAKEASTEVAIARCLPETGPVGRGQPGWVTIVVAPWSSAAQPLPSAELMRQVRDHLAARAPATVATRIRIVAPTYVRVSVSAQVSVTEPGRAAEIIEDLRKRIDSFLHPLTGGPGGNGWAFGQSIHLSQITAVVRGAPGIDRISRVQLSSDGSVFGDVLPVREEWLPSPGPHLIKAELGG